MGQLLLLIAVVRKMWGSWVTSHDVLGWDCEGASDSVLSFGLGPLQAVVVCTMGSLWCLSFHGKHDRQPPANLETIISGPHMPEKGAVPWRWVCINKHSAFLTAWTPPPPPHTPHPSWTLFFSKNINTHLLVPFLAPLPGLMCLALLPGVWRLFPFPEGKGWAR